MTVFHLISRQGLVLLAAVQFALECAVLTYSLLLDQAPTFEAHAALLRGGGVGGGGGGAVGVVVVLVVAVALSKYVL